MVKENVVKYAFIDNGTCFFEPTPIIPETVGQYTGIKDKNDKKIFEGDITKSEANELHHISGRVVEWNDYTGMWLSQYIEWYYLYYVAEVSEVIGNIYENPELVDMKINRGGDNISSFDKSEKTIIEQSLNDIRKNYVSNDDFLVDLFEVLSYILEQIRFEKSKTESGD